MGITVRFFTSLREIEIHDRQLGNGQIANVDDVCVIVVDVKRPTNILAAFNHDHVALALATGG